MLDQAKKVRDRALFDLASDSKLRGCDLVKVKIGDLVAGGRVRNHAMVIKQKTKRPVQFELLEPGRSTILSWLERRGGGLDDFAFRAGLIAPITLASDNMRGWSTSGLPALGFDAKITAHTHYGGRRQH